LYKRAIAITSSTLAVCAIAGCGADGQQASTHSHAVASRSTTSKPPAPAPPRAGRKTLCATAITSRGRYISANEALGRAGLFDGPHDLETLAAARALRAAVEGLHGAESGGKFERFVASLSKQEKVLEAFASHDAARAQKFGNGINAPIEQGLRDLAAFCRGG
jgi:hypothetical protein